MLLLLRSIENSSGQVIEVIQHVCAGLTDIPSGISTLSQLQKMTLDGCNNLKPLPASLCSIKNLQELSLNDIAGSLLVDSIRNFTLEKLSLRCAFTTRQMCPVFNILLSPFSCIHAHVQPRTLLTDCHTCSIAHCLIKLHCVSRQHRPCTYLAEQMETSCFDSILGQVVMIKSTIYDHYVLHCSSLCDVHPFLHCCRSPTS